MARITLELEQDVAREVVRALLNQATYSRGYRNDSALAVTLEGIAGEIESQISEGATKKPPATETASSAGRRKQKRS